MKHKKTRRRGSRRRSRNPMTRRGAPRRMGRRRSRRFRNPMPGVVSDLFGPDMLTFAGGVVIATVGSTMILNRIVAPPAGTARPFNLPGVDYSMLANASTAGTFYSSNAWILAVYKLGIGATAGYLLRNQSPRLSRGIMVGSVAGAISDVLKNTGVITAAGGFALPSFGTTSGTNRNFRSGAGYVPGTPTIFTGPAQKFLAQGGRGRGMGAVVTRRTMPAMENNTEGAFTGAN